MVPEIDDQTEIKLTGNYLFEMYEEAKEIGINTRPVILGPFTLLKLIKYNGNKKANDFHDQIIQAYGEIFTKLESQKCEWIQIDEPALVLDLTEDDILQFKKIQKITI